ncbi:MAG: hypothetical protein ABI885_20165 [Gammaproteobacteria bacterium]
MSAGLHVDEPARLFDQAVRAAVTIKAAAGHAFIIQEERSSAGLSGGEEGRSFLTLAESPTAQALSISRMPSFSMIVILRLKQIQAVIDEKVSPKTREVFLTQAAPAGRPAEAKVLRGDFLE